MNLHTSSTSSYLSETDNHNTVFGSTVLHSESHLQQSSFSEQTELDRQSTNKRKVEEKESNHRAKKPKRSDSNTNALGPLINFLRPITNSFVGSFTDSINTIANFLLPPRTYKKDTGARNSSTNKNDGFVFPMQRSDIPVVKHKYKSKKKKSDESRPTLNMSSSKDLFLLEQLQRDQDIQGNVNLGTVMNTTTPNKISSQHFQSPGLSPINGTKSAESEMNGAWSKFLQDKSGQPNRDSPDSKLQPKSGLENGVRSTWKSQLTTSVRATKQHNKRNSLDSYFSSMNDLSLDLSDYSQSNTNHTNNNNNASRSMDIDYERTVEQEKQRLAKERSEISETLGKGRSRESAIDLTDDSIIFAPAKGRRRANSTSALIASQIQILLEQSNHRKQIAAQEAAEREQRINQSLNTLRTAAAEKLKQDQAIINKIKRRAQADQGVKKLTEEEEKIVELALDGDDEEVLAEGFNLKVTRGDICRLQTPEWLNDEVINFYMNVLMDRNSKEPSLPKMFIFNTFFFSMLEKGYERVKKWTRKVDVFSLNYVIIPVHLGVHWCLAVINFVDKRFEYYDSMGGPNKAALKAMRNYLIQEYKDKKKQQFDLTGWTDYMPRDIPQQQNGYDCGVFMCRYADCISQNKPFNFKQKDMQTIRKRMILDILSKSYSG
mmetsp:Transcript_25006/g.35018  ORF Transcript_25006/g.35018 Transcript_25006/m.35018 type:complete len:660 (+) Transcript_25006:108-2087(+)